VCSVSVLPPRARAYIKRSLTQRLFGGVQVTVWACVRPGSKPNTFHVLSAPITSDLVRSFAVLVLPSLEQSKITARREESRVNVLTGARAS